MAFSLRQLIRAKPAETSAAGLHNVASDSVVSVRGISKRYGSTLALDGVDLELRRGEIYGLIGPDGAGKSSLLKAIAGVLAHDAGELRVFAQPLSNEAEAERIKDRIGLMPQGLGQNLYADLSIEENIDYFAGLRLLRGEELRSRKEALLQATRLHKFRDRPMKNLSGGMKQKLGLVCTLIHEPGLVILDEPTTGVDPVSRREFWSILARLLEEKQITALVSTAYMDEASRFHRVSLMHNGKVLAAGEPAELRQLAPGALYSLSGVDASQQMKLLGDLQSIYPQIEILGQEVRLFVDQASGAQPIQHQVAAIPAALLKAQQDYAGLNLHELEPELEDVFIALLRQRYGASLGGAELKRAEFPGSELSSHANASDAAVTADGLAIAARQLSRHFGEFKAVDQVSFAVKPGEIFGLLGANGAGKSTVIKMLTGILQPSSGAGWVAGADMRSAGRQIRERIGYMSQAFSLYLDLSVQENIRLYGGIYGLTRSQIAARMEWILDMAGLRPYAQALAASLPMGLRQRLALGCALIHQPTVLFLDEPTSGVDPIGRRAFWDVLQRLSRQENVTILVTTHYMSEAEHCDHIALMYAGKVVADASPEQLKNDLQQQAGQLYALSCRNPAQALQVLQQAGYQASLFGARIHFFSALSPAIQAKVSDTSGVIAQITDILSDFSPLQIQEQSLSMEDVFVHIVTALEQRDAAKTTGVAA